MPQKRMTAKPTSAKQPSKLAKGPSPKKADKKVEAPSAKARVTKIKEADSVPGKVAKRAKVAVEVAPVVAKVAKTGALDKAKAALKKTAKTAKADAVVAQETAPVAVPEKAAKEAKPEKAAKRGRKLNVDISPGEGATALAGKWATLFKKAEQIDSKPYSMKNMFEEKTAIVHKVLGWGYILANRNDRLEVLFKDGIKYLISNYKP